MKITSEAPNTILVTKSDNVTQTIDNVVSVEYLPNATREIVAYSQRDSRWASDLMMGSNTIGGWGCAMVACAMLASRNDATVTPKTLNQYLKAHNGYTEDNRLIWASVPGLQFKDYHVWRDIEANIPLFLEEVAKHPVIIQVDFRPGGELNTHFVLALSSDGNDVDILDPWDGAKTKLLKRYAVSNWNLARAIYAMAVYE